MNQKLSYFLNVLLAVGLFLLVFRYGCNPEYKDKPIVISEVADTNAIHDRIDDYYSKKILRYEDTIEGLKGRLKSSKTVFKTKYKEILRDSLITDSNCLITLYYANTTILQQDSIIDIQARGLDACELQVNNLRNQVNLNKGYSEKLLLGNIELTNENEKLKSKVKRNRLFAGIVSAILVSFVLIK